MITSLSSVHQKARSINQLNSTQLILYPGSRVLSCLPLCLSEGEIGRGKGFFTYKKIVLSDMKRSAYLWQISLEKQIALSDTVYCR